jgi:hypothetical protein
MTGIVILGTMIFAGHASGVDLERFQWKNRLLLVFAPDRSDSGFQAISREVEGRQDDFQDRDMVLIPVFEAGRFKAGEETLSLEQVRELRRRFSVKAGRFTMILIGKDGGVKLKREYRTGLQEIFDLIDSMPMRQQEMRRND